MSTITSNNTDSRIAANHHDGLIDIFIGCSIFFAGLFLWTEMVWMAAIFVPVLLPSFQAARKRFLQPRIGNLDHNSRKQVQAQKIVFFVTLLLGAVLLVMISMLFAQGFISGLVNEWLRQYFLLLIGIIFASIWVFAAAMLRINRFYLYAVFTMVTLGAAQITMLPFWLALSILGGLVVFVGLLNLIRFLQQRLILE